MQDSSVFTLIEGSSPLIVSMPHNGELIPDDILTLMNDCASRKKDTDWKLLELYDFLQAMDVTVLAANYSRYVIDLNRSPDNKSLYPGQNVTELCPTSTFDCEPLYKVANPSDQEVQQRVLRYWQPYHSEISNQINRLKAKHQQVLLYEAHSIASHVPRFFEGQLPDFNWGTNDGVTCPASMVSLLSEHDYANYSQIINGRFKGGYITRHYSQPEQGIFTLQLELSQATYMDEGRLQYDNNKAQQVQKHLQQIIKDLETWLLNAT